MSQIITLDEDLAREGIEVLAQQPVWILDRDGEKHRAQSWRLVLQGNELGRIEYNFNKRPAYSIILHDAIAVLPDGVRNKQEGKSYKQDKQ